MANPISADLARPPVSAEPAFAAFLRTVIIALAAFLTVVDLFATQAILPSLVKLYGVSPAAMSFAVNASTIGMAVSGLAVAYLSPRINRRWGVVASLALLSIPTTLLAFAPDLGAFTALRIIQGLLMSAAFTLTLAYLAEELTVSQTASAFAAYITGNVASNLFGRMISAGVVDHLGVATNFFVFAGLNLGGAVLVSVALRRTSSTPRATPMGRSPVSIWREHVANRPLRAAFAIGFCILFAFIGTFTYINFVLVRPPFNLAPMMLGLVYLVFAPSIVTTPLAGRAVDRFGTRRAFWGALALAGIGLPLLLTSHLVAVLAGLVLIAVGTFFAQAIATGFVGRVATTDRGSASGLYLASYFIGGLAGSAVLGQLFDALGWPAAVAGIAASIGVAALLGARLRKRKPLGTAA